MFTKYSGLVKWKLDILLQGPGLHWPWVVDYVYRHDLLLLSELGVFLSQCCIYLLGYVSRITLSEDYQYSDLFLNYPVSSSCVSNNIKCNS